jgi:hypothetical protein
MNHFKATMNADHNTISGAGEDGDLEGQPMPASRSHTRSSTDKAALPGERSSNVVDPYMTLTSITSKNEAWAIFRRFGDLNTLNLLCFQFELSELREQFYTMVSNLTKDEFRAVEREDRIVDFMANYELDSFFGTRKEVGKPSPKEKLLEIRLKLKEYSKLRPKG